MQTGETATRTAVTTTVDVKTTGHVRRALGDHRFDYTFEGDTLGAFLQAFFAEHEGLEEMLIAATEDEARTAGWARLPPDLRETLPGGWFKNPEGEQTRPYARVLVNGRFNELLDGFATELEDGDRVALVYPFMYCC
jgi:molybdopterin converting factor small subunit